ncbi:hypothetical protein Leryth_011012 [Lithospermum erythrorhizon]|nr:hypothetical protein Leryth_011012 [Lithospermum erythrorhizon]
MAGIIYLKTDRFEVKLEGITFKARDFESLCTLDFLFPDGKIWSRLPVVGFDIIRHPRDHNVILLLLCIGVGCLILRFHVGEPLPKPIIKFLTDERIHFVGFGIPRKSDIFPYEELGLTRQKNDIAYLAASRLNDSAYKRSELKHLARKVLGIKEMIGLTDASSFERHEHIKCVICQLFITSVIGMALLRSKDKKKLEDSPNMLSFLKTFNTFPLLSEGWLNMPKLKKNKKSSPRMSEKRKNAIPVKMKPKESKFDKGVNMNVKTKERSNAIRTKKRVKEEKIVDDIDMNIRSQEWNDGIRLEKQDNMGYFRNDTDIIGEIKVELPKEESTSHEFGNRKGIETFPSDEFTFDDCFESESPKEIKGVKDGISLHTQGRENYSSDDCGKDVNKSPKRPLKGILKCASSSRLLDKMDIMSHISSYEEPITPSIGMLRCASSARLHQMDTMSPISSSYKESITPSTGLLRCASSPRLHQMETMSPTSSYKEPTTPLKGILKCPSSSRLDHMEIISPIPSYKEPTTPSSLRRANSKGLNVSFAFKL